MRLQIYGTKALEQKLLQKSLTDFTEVSHRNIRAIYSRAAKPGGTPVDSNELRRSLKYRDGELGYGAPHAPHVEYGHRKVGGGFVPGQYYLKRNVDTQRPIYKLELKTELRK